MFAAYRIDEQLAKALERKVWLPSGGSLVIDRTEAMTVIDVNTGKFTGQGGNLEETVTRNNLEAAEEIVRQLRLRDVGGIIVIDFIDMVLESNRELVLRRLLECLARDRTKHQVAEVTSLGLVQMTRKRVGAGLLEAFSQPCECCNGRGVISRSSGRAGPPRVRRGTAGPAPRHGAGGNGNGQGRQGRRRGATAARRPREARRRDAPRRAQDRRARGSPERLDEAAGAGARAPGRRRAARPAPQRTGAAGSAGRGRRRTPPRRHRRRARRDGADAVPAGDAPVPVAGRRPVSETPRRDRGRPRHGRAPVRRTRAGPAWPRRRPAERPTRRRPGTERRYPAGPRRPAAAAAPADAPRRPQRQHRRRGSRPRHRAPGTRGYRRTGARGRAGGWPGASPPSAAQPARRRSR